MGRSYEHDEHGTEAILRLLNSLPPHYPVNTIVVDGFEKPVSTFVTVKNGLAYFTEMSGGLAIVDVNKITVVDSPPPALPPVK